MQLLFDLLPVILFVATYMATDDIYIATGVIIVAIALQVVYTRIRYGRVDKMLWASFWLIVVLGGLTLVLQDNRFIMWKPTLLYWLFAAVLALSPLVAKKNLIRLMLETHIAAAPNQVWRNLNTIWIVFMLAMGALNLYVALNFSEAFWVQFKLWGGMGLMLLFMLGQVFFLARYVVDGDKGTKP